MKPLYEIVDLGVNHPDYFQGFGASYTPFEYSAYGIGDTAEEAYQDALEQMASGNVDANANLALLDLPEHCPFTGKVPDIEYESDEERAEFQNYYHVGIRWNIEGEAP